MADLCPYCRAKNLFIHHFISFFNFNFLNILFNLFIYLNIVFCFVYYTFYFPIIVEIIFE